MTDDEGVDADLTTGSPPSSDGSEGDTPTPEVSRPPYSVLKAAARLGVSQSTVARMIKKRKLDLVDTPPGRRGQHVDANQLDHLRAARLRSMEVAEWTDVGEVGLRSASETVVADSQAQSPSEDQAEVLILRLKLVQMQQMVETLAQTDRQKTDLIARLGMPDYLND